MKGAHAIAVAIGRDATAKAEAGGWIVLAAYREYGSELVLVRTAKVGTEGIDAGKTYRLNTNGNFEEAA